MYKIGGLEDPYLGSGQETAGEDWINCPEVEYPDINNFLIETSSLHTGESLKIYKILGV